MNGIPRKHWDIREFNKVNMPVVVGHVSKYPFDRFKGIRVLDLPIYMPDQGWAIPNEILNQFLETILLACGHEGLYGNRSFLFDHYVYITIDQKIVTAGNTGRRAGAHSDAYIEDIDSGKQIDLTLENSDLIKREVGEVSHTYIIYDKFPTHFYDAAFPIEDTNCDSVLKTFDDIAATAPVVTFPAYTLLKLDPYVVHGASVATETTERTFVKISISKKRYAREGNTHNDAFSYNWTLGPRDKDHRNHPW